MTRQRQLIYNIIQRADDHPTAEMIYARAKAEMPSIAFGTVYRNLKLMVDAGEILHIPVAGEPDRYDKTIRPHEHMQCIECGRVAEIIFQQQNRRRNCFLHTQLFLYLQ